ncbi:DNA gyrase subunit B GyrB (fragment) [Bradyrhizobium sp. ORS 278]|uniref:hypothetical protein n=1 Tax=Bradyrhizobium sp. (strain ORS 278) TaxID=114615 RepID=UPI00015088A4
MTRRSWPGLLAGLFVVNALSEWLQVRVWRDGKEHVMRFGRGRSEAPLRITGDAGIVDGAPRRGTEITFCPDARVFTTVGFDEARIEQSLRRMPVFKVGVTVTLSDQRSAESKTVTLRL